VHNRRDLSLRREERCENAWSEVKMISPLADFSFDYHDLLFRPAPEQ
jgi:hypothetical protein